MRVASSVLGGLVTATAVIYWIRPTHSYHILKKLDSTWAFWWPMSSFGSYCTSQGEAEKQFQRETVGSGLRLVKYRVVTTWYGSLRGITGEPEILDERNK